MAISGSASPSFEARIEAGKLIIERQTLRQNVCSDLDIAIHDLLQGKKIHITAYGDMASRLRRTIEMALGQGDTDAPIAKVE